MAMSKIERIDKEIQKTREKITEYQNRLRGLEAQKTEAENLQIVQLVRSMRLTPVSYTHLSALATAGRFAWGASSVLLASLKSLRRS